jgi:hypothetical protein
VKKFTSRDEVRESLGKPDRSAEADGGGYDEYRTHMKISEPTVAGVNFIMAAETFCLLEVWMFPYQICQTMWTTVFGQDLRFEYGNDGEVIGVRINGTPMHDRASLP